VNKSYYSRATSKFFAGLFRKMVIFSYPPSPRHPYRDHGFGRGQGESMLCGCQSLLNLEAVSSSMRERRHTSCDGASAECEGYGGTTRTYREGCSFIRDDNGSHSLFLQSGEVFPSRSTPGLKQGSGFLLKTEFK
jgi:hypothetical protein